MNTKVIKHRLAFWLSISPTVALAAVAALIAYLTVTLWLRNIPECFSGAAAFGDLVVGVSLSVLAAFIFYVMDVHVKEFRNRARVNAYIGPILKHILIVGLGFVHSIDTRREVDIRKANHYSVPDIIRILRRFHRLHPNSSSLLQGNYQGRMEDIKESITKVLVHYPNLDPELNDILNGILQSYMFMRIETFDTEEEITTMAEPVLEILFWLRDLHQYTAKHIPSYLRNPNHPDFAMYEAYQQDRDELRKGRRIRNH